MALEIKTASVDLVVNYMSQILEIDRSHFGQESWCEDSFLADLPLKFDVSLLMTEDDKLLGFCILSKKTGGIHLHKTAFLKGQLGKGLGTKMYDYLETNLINLKMTLLPFKIPILNYQSLNFHFKRGFKIQGVEGNYFIISKNGK